MTPSADALLRATSNGQFADADSRLAEYVASIEEAARKLPPESPERARLVAEALAALGETRKLALCRRASLKVKLEEMRNARRYAPPVPASPTVSVTG